MTKTLLRKQYAIRQWCSWQILRYNVIHSHR